MASFGITISSFHLLLLLILSLAIQPHATRESKFFTKLTHYLSNSPAPAPTPAPAPVLVPGMDSMPEPVLAPKLSPTPAPAPAEKEYGYGLYGQESGKYSSEEYRTSTLDQGLNNEIPKDDELEKGSTQFEKLLGSNNNVYNNNDNVYNNNYNDNGNRFSSSMDENINGYTTDRYNKDNNGYSYNQNNNGYSYNQNNNDNYNTMRYGNENNGNEFMSSKEENHAYNNNGYVMQQQGLSDTRFLENGKYSWGANNNGNHQETSYDEEVNDNGTQRYYNRNVNEKSQYEFDTMEEYERPQGYPEIDPNGYVP